MSVRRFARKEERGLENVLGERGTLVPGGERQRIALARAMLRKPGHGGRSHGVAELGAMRSRPTVILIAHRAESLAPCDRVLHFEAGWLAPQ